MRTACERQCALVMEQLRDKVATGLPTRLDNCAPLVDGFYFSWDAQQAQVDLSLHRPAREAGAQTAPLFELRTRVSGEPRWLSMNISLGSHRFASGDVIALIGALHCPEAETLPAFIRTRANGEDSDTTLFEPLRGKGASVTTALHTVEPADNLVIDDAFHTLIVPLPRRDFTLVLNDLRLFVLPAAAGLRSQPQTLASFAV
ncbi:MAG: hypothetical protein ACK4LQ_07540 [Pararhodobacter sp.]